MVWRKQPKHALSNALSFNDRQATVMRQAIHHHRLCECSNRRAAIIARFMVEA